MQPVQLRGHPQPRFIGMRHRNVNQRLSNAFNVRAQPCAGLTDPGEHRGRRDRQRKQLGNELRSAPQRQQLAFSQMRRQRPHVRTVLHNLGHVLRKLALVQLPAGAMHLLRTMFGDLITSNRYVEYLPALVHHRISRHQPDTARGAMLRQQIFNHHVHRIRTLERLADAPELSARFGALGHAQRPGLLCQSIARRRLARIVAVFGQPRFEFRHARRQLPNLLDQRKQHPDQIVFLVVGKAREIGQFFPASQHTHCVLFVQ